MGSDLDRVIGETVARFRTQAEMSQQALADRMRERSQEHRWSQATVWGIEKGDRALKASEILDLSKVLRCGYLFLVEPSDLASRIRDLVIVNSDMTSALAEIGRQLDRLGDERAKMAKLLIKYRRIASPADIESTDEGGQLEQGLRQGEASNFRVARLVKVVDDLCTEFGVSELSHLVSHVAESVDD